MPGYSRQFVFFNSEIEAKLAKCGKTGLSKFGAYVRTRAKSSIRKRKKISEPGNPPNSHTGKLKKNIFFGYDEPGGVPSVVVGPTKIKRNGDRNLRNLEYGGTRPGKNQPMVYRARPFMRPAFEKELHNAPKAFKDSFK